MTQPDYFKDELEAKLEYARLLGEKEFSKALFFAKKYHLAIKPNRYIKNHDDLVKKAAADLKQKGEYERAYETIIKYAPNINEIKEYARDCAQEIFQDLAEEYEYANNPQKETIYEIAKHTEKLKTLQQKHFSQEQMLAKADLNSILDTLRLTTFMQSYFIEVLEQEKQIEELLKDEHYELIPKRHEKIREIDDFYTGFIFTGYSKNL